MTDLLVYPGEGLWKFTRRSDGRRSLSLGRSALFGVGLLTASCSDGAIIYGAPHGDDGSELVAGDVDIATEPTPSNVSTAGAAASGIGGSGNLASGGKGSAPAVAEGEELPSWSPPALRQAVALPDDELARAALKSMGSAAVGAEGSCRNCHTLGRPTLTHWLSLTSDFATACLSDTGLSDVAAVDAMIGCFRSHAAPEPSWSAGTFGVYAAAAHLPWFSFVFEHASENQGAGPERHAEFVTRVGMPRSGTRWEQAEFDVIAEWFARGLPRLFDLVPEDGGEACTPALDPNLRAHIDDMHTQGWKARNREVPLLMFGCSDGQATSECLAGETLAADTDYGADWDVAGAAQIRILYDNSGGFTNYWSRSSADGRFMASGLRYSSDSNFAGQFLDLQEGEVIPGGFAYDPTFFPDNSGFMVQRSGYSPSSGPTNGSANPDDTAVICNQSVLSGSPSEVTGDESECTPLSGQVGLYQQLAKSVDGDDYWVAYGSFDEDNGGFSPVYENPSAAFDSHSTTTLLPLINQGNGFVPGSASRLATPLQGDPMLSPSGRLMITRLKGREYTTEVDGNTVVRAEQSGYALSLVSTVGSNGTLSASLTDVGRVCLQGGKAVVSYDERWLVLHHYVTANDAVELGYSGPDDPAFADYLELGASNLYLVDLLDGSTRAITQMGPGQYALFPHFRSDGWIYFVVRTLLGEEWFAATNAAVLLDGAE